MFSTLVTLALAASQVSSLAIPEKRSGHPFSQLVAFGDEFSDNGNGSYAAGITGAPGSQDRVYGFGTWTNGPVAVSYLSDMLNVPLKDYAFGSSGGGGVPGAMMDNTYSNNAAKLADGKTTIPSISDQINNYTQESNNNIGNSLAFIWPGAANDLIGFNPSKNRVNTYAWNFTFFDINTDFGHDFAAKITADAELLVSKGAPYVFVGNMYPRNLSPGCKEYICTNPNDDCVGQWGQTISYANNALKNALAASQHAGKFIYHDTNAFMTEIIQSKDAWGMTEPVNAYCDGDAKVAQWDKCISGAQMWDGSKSFLWMNYVQPTTLFHNMIAIAMKVRIDDFFVKGI